ncbi:MAG TPA: helix-turn-helix transcriptional regulator [Streptosporangiaceae bacterium]|nr:helix-turn-helix transcriptional regulator [Streptosporangiaceae bacterium]
MTQQRLDQRYQFGELLRRWRQDRGVSQLTLASDADVSPRHLSFVETGRSAPSRGLVLRLAEHLEIPLRGRNELLLAAGFAPEFSQTGLDAPGLSMVRVAIRQLLTGHNPYPALVVDRDWNLVEANASTDVLIEDVPDELAAEPFNVLRYSLHPAGLAARILNLGQWREHVLGRLDRQVRATGDAGLAELYRELRDYPAGSRPAGSRPVGSRPAGGNRPGAAEVVVPLRLLHKDQELSLFSTTTLFGTPNDVTVEELAIESFYPADEKTAEYLRSVAP